ncbi:hypothetical protein [Streptomyces sp. NPDC048350]|uniref:hypothetical protein n=1 Tax=Streptomyces sp. NPDC048350 TaxID=3365538 RepID=UPI00371DEF32
MASSSAAPVPSAFDVLRTRYSKRLPARLEDLTGPTQGTVDLPLHVVWSGRRSYQLEGIRSRMSLYRTWAPPTATEYGPVLSLDDVIGTKVRALADRCAVRDLIDGHAASLHRTNADLEALGRRHARFDFSL